MTHDPNGMNFEGIKERLGIAVEIQIGIEIGYYITTAPGTRFRAYRMKEGPQVK